MGSEKETGSYDKQLSSQEEDQVMAGVTDEVASASQPSQQQPPQQQEQFAPETKRKREEISEDDTPRAEQETTDDSSKRFKSPSPSEGAIPDTQGAKQEAVPTSVASAATPPPPDENNASAQEDKKEASKPSSSTPSSPSKKKNKNQKRWRVHQMAEDYVDLASNIMLHPSSQLGPYGYEDNYQGNGENGMPRQQYPLELVSALGYLKSPLRRPTVIEKWSPYEIAVFEAGMGHYGKDFYQIHKAIETKSTKDVVDFYYVWKKTSHYKVWKQQYVNPGEIISDGEEEGTPVKKPAAR